ncbi:GNAT family N-acetyltransferase [Exiguobacterium undae]|uniref:GNAT family N-acetyltransferase n=1 Tax=Exiguobacterium undae TaxID=169177 RepID=UPI00048570FC|nr:GNAT family N-acetyltransferase [Exiguobacterium undae]
MEFRKCSNDDFEFLLSLVSDPEMVRYIGEGKIRNREGAQDFLEWIYKTYDSGSNKGLMLLVDKEVNNPIGHAGLIPQTIDGMEQVEIGYCISREHWGKGYATEAAEALRNYGLNVLSEEKLIALIPPGNIASKKVATKVGMNLEKEIILRGQDVHMYSISK